MDFTFIKDIVIAIAAFVGMGFGLYNFLSLRSKEKVKLKVIPKAVIYRGATTDGKEAYLTTSYETNISKLSKYIAIEVINYSDFDITVTNLGFVTDNPENRFTVCEPITQDGRDWPSRIKPRDSVVFYGLRDSLMNYIDANKITQAFIETACGEYRIGTSKALKYMMAEKNV